MGAIFYISTLLTSGDDNQTSAVAPRKTKAASITYSKLIALNQVTPELTPTPPIEALTETPTPTETVLAYVNPTGTGLASSGASLTTTLTPTRVKDLPDAGFIYNGLIIFAASMVLVFFSFLF